MTDIATLGLQVESSGVTRASKSLGAFSLAGDKAAGTAGRLGLASKASFALVAAGAAGAALSIGAAVPAIADFDRSMGKLGAVTRASISELTAMRDVAKDLGSTTEFSSTQAADGLTFLGMAGFSAAESMAAIPSVLDLATASGLGLARAADITSNIMSGFGIEAAKSGDVADVLAAASSRANTDVSQLGEAMSTVAPISAALDMSLADTAAAIGVLSDAGIQGARAGTAMRGVLAALAGPTSQATTVLRSLGLTIQDIDPATNDLSVVMDRLGKANISTAQAMTVFGREAASGALVLVDGAKRLGQFGDELGKVQGAASDMAGTIRDDLQGDLDSLKSAVSGVALALGEAGLTAILRGATQLATLLARGVTSVIDAFGSAIHGIGDFGSYILGLSSANNSLTLATNNTTIAMGDEVRQANELLKSMSNSRVMSLDVAGVKLAQTRAHIANMEAMRQENIETIKSSEQYRTAAAEQAKYAASMTKLIDNIQSAEDRFGQAPIGAVDALRDHISKLQEAKAVQDELIGSAAALPSEIQAARVTVEELESAIAKASNGMVVLEGDIGIAVDLTAELVSVGESLNFQGGINDAKQLAEWMNITLDEAIKVSKVLAHNAYVASVGRGRGGDPRKFGGGAKDIQKNDVRAQLAYQPGGTAGVALPKVRRAGGGRRSSSARKSGGGVSRATEAAREYSRAQKDAERVINSLKTETQLHNEELVELNKLQKAGHLSADQLAKAQANLNTEFQNAQWEKTGIPKITDALSDAIMNAKSLGDVFKAQLKRMAADLLSSGIQNAIKSVFDFGSQKSSGGLLGGLFGGGGGGGLFSGLLSFDGGGYTGSGSRSGGIDGKGGFPAILHPNEQVIDFTKAPKMSGASKQHSGGGVINLNVVSDPSVIVQIAQNTTGQMIQVNNEQQARVLPGQVNALIGQNDVRVR